jgi:hypothetical protein
MGRVSVLTVKLTYYSRKPSVDQVSNLYLLPAGHHFDRINNSNCNTTMTTGTMENPIRSGNEVLDEIPGSNETFFEGIAAISDDLVASKDKIKPTNHKLEIVDSVDEVTAGEIMSTFGPVIMITGISLAWAGAAESTVFGWGVSLFAVGLILMIAYISDVVMGSKIFQYLSHLRNKDPSNELKAFVDGFHKGAEIYLVLQMNEKVGKRKVVARHRVSEKLFERTSLDPFTSEEVVTKIRDYKTSVSAGHLKINSRVQTFYANRKGWFAYLQEGKEFLFKRYCREGHARDTVCTFFVQQVFRDGTGKEYSFDVDRDRKDDLQWDHHRMTLGNRSGAGSLCNFCSLNLATFYFLSCIMLFVPYKMIFERSYKSTMKVVATSRLSLLSKQDILELGITNLNEAFPFVEAYSYNDIPGLYRWCFSPTIIPITLHE